MLSASHLIAGGAIGSRLPKAGYAIPLAFVSHFVLDLVPHSCFHMLPGASGPGLMGWVARTGIVVDLAAAVVLWVLVCRRRERWVIISAALAAVLPDILSYMYPINQWFRQMPGSEYLAWIHSTFHCDVSKSQWALGFVTQVVVIGWGLRVLVYASRRKMRGPGFGNPGPG